MTSKNLIFLSYGSSNEYHRALFSILSYSSWCERFESATRMIIYTDNPLFFEPFLQGLNVEYYLLTKPILEEMVAGTGFNHRIKVAVIDLTFKTYPNQDVLFLDSDTFFIKDSAALFTTLQEGESFMHLREFTLLEGLDLFTSYNQREYPDAFINYIKKRDFYVGESPMQFSENDYSWNSGVLGLSRDFAKLMKDVLVLTDEFYKHSKWFISEQMAFSLILQRKTRIQSAHGFVFHYWDKQAKILVDNLLNDLLQTQELDQLRNKAVIRRLTREWKKKLRIDDLRRQIKAALSNGSYYYASKKIVQLFMYYF